MTVTLSSYQFQKQSVVQIPAEVYEKILLKIDQLERKVNRLEPQDNTYQTHLSKKQFLQAIGKSNFVYNDLVKGSFKLQVVHRGKSVYIPTTEVQRFFQTLK